MIPTGHWVFVRGDQGSIGNGTAYIQTEEQWRLHIPDEADRAFAPHLLRCTIAQR